MPLEITKELLRRIEIVGMVSEKPGYYTENDFCDHFNYSVQNLRLDMQILREKGVDIHSTKKVFVIDRKLDLQTLNNLISSYIAVNDNYTIRNLKPIQKVFKDETLITFIKIVKSINSRSIIEMEYGHDKYNQPIKRLITPIGLNNLGKTFHLIALENDDINNLKFFLLEKIISIKFTNKKSSLKELPNLNEVYKYSWGSYFGGEATEVKLLFDKKTGEGLKDKIFVEEQEFDETSEGYILKMKVKLSYEFISWVMGWGGSVKIISPKKLKDEVLKRAKEIVKSYK